MSLTAQKAMGEKGSLVLQRYRIGLHRKNGALCSACERGSKAGMDYYEGPGGFKALLCYQCVIRLMAALAEMGYLPVLEVAT